MNAESLLSDNKELAHKRRSVPDLIRHISTTTGESPNYSILLGAGCSVTSGINPATELIKGWTLELHERFSNEKASTLEDAKAYLEKNHGSWYNPLNPYASLFEKKYDFATQRRRFVENEVDGRLPSIGYAYLSSLASKNYINTVFTTNFDDLINEAFYQYSNIRPQVCAHDSSIASISITSKRPKIIKLHGDYLFDDIKSTLKETESLEQNTKEKLMEFCKEYGLIVVGYSGNDRSIMDVLEFLTKQENYLKNGLYWCLRKNDEISPTLRNLLWKDKVYPVIIDGFDEFFAEAHNSILKKPLDLKSNAKENKLKIAINYIIDDNYNLQKNPTIRNEIDFIKRNENSSDISSFINELSKDEKEDGELSLADIRNLLEVEAHIEKGEIKEAYTLCDQHFAGIEPTDEQRKYAYIRKLIKISKYLGDMQNASRWCEKLIDIDNNNINNYLLKSSCIKLITEKYQFLKDVSLKFPNKYIIYNELSNAGEELLKNNPTNGLVSASENVKSLEKSLKLEPSLSNNAWLDIFDALHLQKKIIKKPDTQKEISERLEKLIKDANSCNQSHITTLKLMIKQSWAKADQSLILKTIDSLYEIYSQSSKKERYSIIKLLNKSIKNSDHFDDPKEYKTQAKKFYEFTIKDKDINKSSQLLLDKAFYLIGLKKDYLAAENYLNSALECKDITDNIASAIEVCSIINKGKLKIIRSIIEKEKHTFKRYHYNLMLSYLEFEEGNMSLCNSNLEQAFHAGLPLSQYLCNKTYNLLTEKKYDEIIKSMDQYIDRIDLDEYDTSIINYNYAAKKCDVDKYDKTKILNLSAKSLTNDVKMCAFILEENTVAAKRLAQHEIEKSHLNYIRYSKWPIIEEDFLINLEIENLEKTA